MQSIAIQTKELGKSFGNRSVLRDIDLQISQGELVLLAGPNGAGKTTLLRILASLSRPTTGWVQVLGNDLFKTDVHNRSCLGFVSHQTFLYDDLSALQNLWFFARLYGIPNPQDKITELVELVELNKRRDDLVRTYSKGMQQRLSLARALLHHPEILLLDEPYSSLDQKSRKILDHILNQELRKRRTVILTTHEFCAQFEIPPRVLTLGNGALLFDGKVRDEKDFNEILNTPRLNMASASEKAKRLAFGLTKRNPAREPSDKPVAFKLNRSNYFRQVGAILAKDFISELHTHDIFSSMAFFGILAVLIFGFAFGLQGNVSSIAVPAILWSSIGFSGILGLSKSVINEYKASGVEGLMLSPMESSAIFLGKALGNLVFISVVEIILLFLVSLLFNISVIRLDILVTLLAGSIGYAALGTLLAMIAVNTRTREIMLPILFLPLAVPVFLAGIQITGGLMKGLSFVDLSGWIQLLGLYDLVVIVVSMLTFEFTLGE